jgi:DNA-binding NtrC family response regulator
MNASSAGPASGFSSNFAHAVGSAAPGGGMPPPLSFARNRHTQPLQEALAVLVVDDDPLIIDMLAVGLPLFGLQTVTALSASEARDVMATRSDIGVVVSDINMPTETGLALAQILLRDRAEEDAVEVILMTGRSSTEDAIAALRSNVTDFVSKPRGRSRSQQTDSQRSHCHGVA